MGSNYRVKNIGFRVWGSLFWIWDLWLVEFIMHRFSRLTSAMHV